MGRASGQTERDREHVPLRSGYMGFDPAAHIGEDTCPVGREFVEDLVIQTFVELDGLVLTADGTIYQFAAAGSRLS